MPVLDSIIAIVASALLPLFLLRVLVLAERRIGR
jgi:hypothetical protein